MKAMLAPFTSELCLYVANVIISHIPVHWIRILYYKRIMGFKIGTGSSIFMGCHFDCSGGLSVGKNSTINDNCFLDTRGKISIGDCVAIASGVWIITMKHDIESQDFIAISATVQIGDFAFIGRRATILQGCSIGYGAILGAGSVLTKSIPEFEVWAGNPARKIGYREQRNFTYNCHYVRLFH